MTAFASFQPTVTQAARLAKLRRLAWLLDAAFVVPGTKFRFGLDGIVGLAPGIGDTLMGLTSLYIVWEARKLGLPAGKLARMVANVGVETLVGSVPVVGDLFDAAFKANLRNLAIVEDHLGVTLRGRGPSR
ncbi:DUF4112 domain-containing protein [Lichenihabitans sp. Uapishka_5]|uniref:DUF4112 domain-containing protein n=1 Tax=Lichenihabitans sp. Uapishka_5 TaxID=3037302 RepID=UPI0029E7EF73|nr:DUF4112 domain-containing protein [Lichenihabitans sp. Uapishka_5]MDX7950198.1 DUF4112 domain-containing protein [Lichenihabitans sp. Uapishka_5]